MTNPIYFSLPCSLPFSASSAGMPPNLSGGNGQTCGGGGGNDCIGDCAPCHPGNMAALPSLQGWGGTCLPYYPSNALLRAPGACLQETIPAHL